MIEYVMSELGNHLMFKNEEIYVNNPQVKTHTTKILFSKHMVCNKNNTSMEISTLICEESM